MARPRKTRDDYVVFETMTTRWRDNDAYGHMNNVVFLEYVDSCVNAWLIRSGAVPVPHGPVIGLVVESACVFHAALAYPDPVTTGLKVTRVGQSSVQYEIGIFRGDDAVAAAEARLTHVYVDAVTRRPTALGAAARAALATLMA